MLLSGKFDYDKENQRTLPFNVDIRDLPAYKTVFTGSSSKNSKYTFTSWCDFVIKYPILKETRR